MTKIEHTPERWEVYETSRGKHIGTPHVGISHAVVCDMAIGRYAAGDAHLITLAPTAPHDCTNPKCPGVINKHRLDLWPALLAALKELLVLDSNYAYADGAGQKHWRASIAKARALIARAKGSR